MNLRAYANLQLVGLLQIQLMALLMFCGLLELAIRNRQWRNEPSAAAEITSRCLDSNWFAFLVIYRA